MKNEYFPCILVEHDDYYSVITSDFHYFDDYFGDKGGGGYSVEKLAKKVREKAEEILLSGNKREFPSWLFNMGNGK